MELIPIHLLHHLPLESRLESRLEFGFFPLLWRASFYKAPILDDSSSSFMTQMYLDSVHKGKYSEEKLSSSVRKGKEHSWL
jgi:hypothetical protein